VVARQYRFSKPNAEGARTITRGGITWSAIYYPPANGMRGYWVVRRSDHPIEDYERDGNDWYESSWANVRATVIQDIERTIARAQAMGASASSSPGL